MIELGQEVTVTVALIIRKCPVGRWTGHAGLLPPADDFSPLITNHVVDVEMTTLLCHDGGFKL